MNAVSNEKRTTSMAFYISERYTNFPRFQGARPDHVEVQSIEFWPMARDTFSSNQETYLSWEV